MRRQGSSHTTCYVFSAQEFKNLFADKCLIPREEQQNERFNFTNFKNSNDLFEGIAF